MIRNGKKIVSKEEIIFDFFPSTLEAPNDKFSLSIKNDNDVSEMETKHLLVSFNASDLKTLKIRKVA